MDLGALDDSSYCNSRCSVCGVKFYVARKSKGKIHYCSKKCERKARSKEK